MKIRFIIRKASTLSSLSTTRKEFCSIIASLINIYRIKIIAMIIFGVNSRRLKNLKSQTHDCGYCKIEKTVSFYFFQKYIHIFWIPIIPIGKTGSSVCSHCHQALHSSQMPEIQKKNFLEEKAMLKTPWGYKIFLFLFLGSWVFVSFFILITLFF